MTLRTILPVLTLSLVTWLGAEQAGRAADVYTADASHSSVIYRIKHMNTSFSWGRFNDITGMFALDESNPADGRFDFQVKADSVDSGNAQRDQHLKGPDFFNAVQFPAIAFKSQTVAKVGTGTGYDVKGDLTLHGVTKPVTLHVVPTGTGKDPKGTPIAGIEANFNIKRSDFGMTKMIPGIGDDVWLYVSIEGMRK